MLFMNNHNIEHKESTVNTVRKPDANSMRRWPGVVDLIARNAPPTLRRDEKSWNNDFENCQEIITHRSAEQIKITVTIPVHLTLYDLSR
jgi:hypothetical protein